MPRFAQPEASVLICGSLFYRIYSIESNRIRRLSSTLTGLNARYRNLEPSLSAVMEKKLDLVIADVQRDTLTDRLKMRIVAVSDGGLQKG